MAKQKIFKSSDSLQPIRNILEEAYLALQDEHRVIADSSRADKRTSALGVVGGGITGIVVSYATIFGAGMTGYSAAGITSGLAVIGGGMLTGLTVFAAPAAVLSFTGFKIAKVINNKRLQTTKKELLEDVVEAQLAIAKALKSKAKIDKERADYLNELNTLLNKAIKNLEEDLES